MTNGMFRTIALTGVVAMSGAAHAADLAAEGVSVWDFSQDQYSERYQTCRVYVCGLEDGDRVLAIGGAPGTPMNITTGGGRFFNATNFSGPARGNPSNDAAQPRQQWDTFLGFGWPTFSTWGLSPNFNAGIAEAGGGQAIVNATNGGWFVTNPPAAPEERKGRIWFGQFTWDTNRTLKVDVLVTIMDANGDIRDEYLSGEFAHDGCGVDPEDDCPADLNDDGIVGSIDLITLLAAWGRCP